VRTIWYCVPRYSGISDTSVFVRCRTLAQSQCSNVGHPDHIKAFADPAAAERWFKENDPEGVAFDYEVIE
jgi:hypothetical protein